MEQAVISVINSCETTEWRMTDEIGQTVTFWGIRTACMDELIYESADLCEDLERVDMLCRQLIDSDVDPIHIHDILEDFLVETYSVRQ